MKSIVYLCNHYVHQTTHKSLIQSINCSVHDWNLQQIIASIIQLIHQCFSNYQCFSHFINLPVIQSICQSIFRSINPSASQSIHHSVIPLIILSFHLFFSNSINHSVIPSNIHPFYKSLSLSMNNFVNQSNDNIY